MLMEETGNFDKIMAELRQEHRAVDGPQHLEMLLRAETEKKKAAATRQISPNRIWAWGLSFASVASLLLGAIAWELHRASVLEDPKVQAVQHVAPVPSSILQSAASDLTSPKRRDALAQLRHAHPRAVRNESGADVEQVAMGDFVALPASEGLPPASAISLVRMRIEQSALQQYGLEVPAEAAPKTLLAEFVVGEDGLPRAIRILP
jgi:hypothetical protein